MFQDWEHHMNRNLDEVWVPSHFEKDVFEVGPPLNISNQAMRLAGLEHCAQLQPACSFVFLLLSYYCEMITS